MNKNSTKLLTTFASIMYVIATIASFFIYGLTIYIAFTVYGFWGGILSLALPILSTIYMFFAVWFENGFFNFFNVACSILILLYIITFSLMIYISNKEDTE